LRYLDRLQPLALLVLRLVLGAIMIGHSYTKVFGGEHRYVGYITSLGLPWWSAYLSIAAEFGGGILLIVGLLTRFAALTLVIDMAVAIAKIHFKNGLLGENGYQFPLSLAAIGVALIFFGAGPISLDSVRGGGRSFSSNRK
jgi:putative oxidoreductase